jgi:arabinogalactan oligomer/maltooligosaccharide transport system substrate-binding protein
MKKFFAFLVVAIFALVLVSCGNTGGGSNNGGNGTTGKTIELTYSGTASDKEFNQGLFEAFKADRKAKGDTNTYIINYFECGPDAIDSTVLDWAAPNAPDVYEAASDKINILYGKGALAKVTGTYKSFIETEMTEFASELVKLNGEIYAYPYTGDNTYYLQYDKSVFTAEEVASMETLLAAAAAKNYKVGYNLETAYWGGAAMFTFGADYEMSYDEDGNLIDIVCDFDSAKGLKAAKAIYSIMHHEAWVNESGVPAEGSATKAVIGGTWDIHGFKGVWGENYACATMPTVTVDGELLH